MEIGRSLVSYQEFTDARFCATAGGFYQDIPLLRRTASTLYSSLAENAAAKEKKMRESKFANPEPLGLLGCGMATILMNLHNAGIFPFSAMLAAMAFLGGGLIQVAAGILEYRRGNVFGLTTFGAYGIFWISLVAAIVLPEWGLAAPTPPAYMGCYLALWGIFTAAMNLGVRSGGPVLRFFFATLAALYFLLAIRDFAASQTAGIIGGAIGVLCGLSAFYLAIAETLEEQCGRKVLPY